MVNESKHKIEWMYVFRLNQTALLKLQETFRNRNSTAK